MTQEELRNHLGQFLGVKGVGAALSAEDAEFLDTVLENGQDELTQLGIALWIISDVPAYAVEGMCMYCAPLAAPRFGLSNEYPPMLQVAGVRKLREVTQDRRTSTGTADYF
jgi:hypothetical protein